MEGRLEVESVVDRVYTVVRDRILQGELAAGTKLRQEALAEELGVSRTPLREALRRLASEGLVDIRAHHGAAVAPLPAGDLDAGFLARLVLEPPAAGLAASVREPAAVATMRAAIEAHRRPEASVEEAFAANRGFHVAAVGATGNRYLVRCAELLWVTRLGFAVYALQNEPPDRVRADADEHERICDAIVAGDSARAERLMYEHIDGARRAFRLALEGSGRTTRRAAS